MNEELFNDTYNTTNINSTFRFISFTLKIKILRKVRDKYQLTLDNQV